jgi:nucleoside-diphosphate-sugar epimerase
LTRSPRAPKDGITWVGGDLADGRGVDELVDGCDAVLHCAGAVRGARQADFDVINVTGTERVARTAARRGAKRLLSLSSLAAREPELSMYALSKRRGERALQDAMVPWTVFRPPAVYGPGDKELLPLFRLMMQGVAVVPGHSGRTSLIYVTDLVRAMVAWLGAPISSGRCFELDDGTPDGYDWSEMIAIAAELRGSSIRRVNVPQAVLATIGFANLWLGRALHRAPMLTPGKVRELFHRDWICRTHEIREALSWRPEVGFAEGLHMSCPA